MMNVFCRPAAILACAIVALSVAARPAAAAVELSITGAEFHALGNVAPGFSWSVYAAALPLDLSAIEVGETTGPFTYGYFETSDFPLGDSDVNDTFDLFVVSLEIEPPIPGAEVGGIAYPDAVRVSTGSGYVDVDFINYPVLVFDPNGLAYAVTFLDPNRLEANGRVELQAQITLLSEAVPEPAAALIWSVLGLGIGVGFVRSRRKKRPH